MASTSAKITATKETGATKKADQVQVAPPSRREFLYYIWGASMVLLLGQATAGLIWFALPRFREGEFGGVFKFQPDALPQEAGDAPISVPEGRFWLSHTNNGGLLALYAVCTHLGCLPPWNDQQFRFICPCHGSQFELDGAYITGPAPRGMDRFSVTITFQDGTILTTPDDGSAVDLGSRRLADIVNVDVDTGNRITI